MEAEKIQIRTVASSSSYRTSPELEQRRNNQLLKLYQIYKENPFDYAIINNSESEEPKIKVHTINQKTKLSSVKQILKRMFHFIIKSK